MTQTNTAAVESYLEDAKAALADALDIQGDKTQLQFGIVYALIAIGHSLDHIAKALDMANEININR